MLGKTNSKRSHWVNSSLKPNETRGQLSDEVYKGVNYYHRFVWGYIVNHYRNEIGSPLIVLGYAAIPLAIELSQWDYPVTYITDTFAGVKKAKRDCEIQAGKFKNIFYFDFSRNCPKGRLLTFLGVLEQMRDQEALEFLSMLLRRVQEVVFAVQADRNWFKVLNGHFDLYMKEYPKKDFYLIALKENGQRKTTKS